MNDLLKDVDRAQIIRWVAIYMLIAGVLSICGGVSLLFLGGLAGLAGVGTAAVLNQSGVSDAEATAAATGLAAAGGLATIYGLLSIITGPAMLVVALGLYRKAPWSRMGTVIIAGLSVISSLLGLLTGGGIGNIIWVIISGFVAYLFYTDAGIKREFGQA